MASLRPLNKPCRQIKKAEKTGGKVRTLAASAVRSQAAKPKKQYYSSKPGITPAMREVAEKATAQFIRELRAGKI